MMTDKPTDEKMFPATYDYAPQHGDTLTVKPELAFYTEVRDLAGEPRQNLAVTLADVNTGEALATLTVNLGEFISIRNGTYIDTNNLPHIDRWLEDNGIVWFNGLTMQSGYCTYPMLVFDEGFLASINDGRLAAYHGQFDTPDKANEAAWAVCGKGERGPELWFFEAHLTHDEDSPTGEGFSFASWNKDKEGRWGEYDGGLYYGYAEAKELEEVIGETVPFKEFSYKEIPYPDFFDACFNSYPAKERAYAEHFGITAPEHTRKERSFEVTITETLKRTVRVRASNEDEARQRVEDGWKNEVHVLGADDFKEVHFTVSERSRDMVR
jgi:hypothetical protein